MNLDSVRAITLTMASRCLAARVRDRFHWRSLVERRAAIVYGLRS